MPQAEYRSTIIGNKELKNKPSDGIVLVESQKNIPNATEPPYRLQRIVSFSSPYRKKK